MSAHQKAVERAMTVIEAYDSSGSYDELFGDLLADLMHYWFELRRDREVNPEMEFDDVLDTARMHYEEEVLDDTERYA